MNVLTYLVVIAVVAVWIGMLVRYRLRWWTAFLSAAVLVFLVMTFFRGTA